ncbi:hypothetical protein HGRIS_005814 [Hohenbuehelia grisea]|uniref:Uncharacterized protein n=1 Tax=Hohenbuehelia grisea TaxID=104357 RepID=A0ABR3JZF4_9AGAR
MQISNFTAKYQSSLTPAAMIMSSFGHLGKRHQSAGRDASRFYCLKDPQLPHSSSILLNMSRIIPIQCRGFSPIVRRRGQWSKRRPGSISSRAEAGWTPAKT